MSLGPTPLESRPCEETTAETRASAPTPSSSPSSSPSSTPAPAPAPTPTPPSGGLRRRLVQLGVVGLIAALAWAVGRAGLFDRAVEAVGALGPWALPAFVVLHVASGVLFVPTAIPHVAGGLLFGLWTGLAAGLVGLGGGATLSFVIGRALGRDWLHRRFAGDARFHGLIRLVGRRGWKIIVLARLSPIFPFSIANYAFGLTPMRATTYGLASVVGSIPSTLVFVSIGAAAGTVGGGDGATRTPGEWALLAVGGVAMVALFVVVRRLALDAFAELRELEKESVDPVGAD